MTKRAQIYQKPVEGGARRHTSSRLRFLEIHTIKALKLKTFENTCIFEAFVISLIYLYEHG